MLHALIMAGGAGTRFWPASRTTQPKQLLNLAGVDTMIQATAGRLEGLVPPGRVLVITNQQLVDAIAEQLPELPRQSILGEPCKRDTAPCVGLAAALIAKTDPDATMVVMPADHVIQPVEAFLNAVRQAAALVASDDRLFVTFGIRPTYPAESFGYIEAGSALSPPDDAQTKPAHAFEVRRFREKPSAAIAREYVASGTFYWNSGIFVWKAQAVLDALRAHEPAMHDHLVAIAGTFGTDAFRDTFAREFEAIRGKSIDFAVMEHYDHVAVIEAPFRWDDIGSWRALARLRGEDEAGNTLVGRTLSVRTTNSIVRSSDDHLVATIGLNDIIVVHTPDATLVANKNDEESVREIVALIKRHGWEEYL
ncbi:MAG: mannose-1-phosphate guanylyltransferase [Planctomycetes bacterium]|nr:mannose-1-phosphate guanylyltransferase [Planctomycetota bacterium]